VAKGQSYAEALKMAEAILLRGPVATQATKLLINAAEGEDAERAIEALAGLAAAGHSELREGVGAFKEKRKPKF
jgi:enoyl-CoA hydratase